MELKYKVYIYSLFLVDGLVALCLLLFTTKLWVIYVLHGRSGTVFNYF